MEGDRWPTKRDIWYKEVHYIVHYIFHFLYLRISVECFHWLFLKLCIANLYITIPLNVTLEFVIVPLKLFE